MTEEIAYTPVPFDPTNPDHIKQIQRLIPDMTPGQHINNPLSKVMFRAGMLVMRKTLMIRINCPQEDDYPASFRSVKEPTPDQILECVDEIIATQWPSEFCDEDPGEPRLYNFEELISDWGTPQAVTHKISINREAAAEAFIILEAMGLVKR